MQKNLTFIVFSVVLALFSSVTTRADDSSTEVSTTETRLREALRSTTLEWHQAQEQITSLQASQAENDKAKADLQAKVDAFSAQLATLTHQANDEKAASDKLVADLNSKITEQATQIEQLNETLKQWEDAYNRAVQIAAAKEAERVKFAINAADLQRIVDDRESKNFALYKLGNEILNRYQEYSLGDAIEAKEPFVGDTRAELENLVQEYKNKLLDQAITSRSPAQASPPTAPIQTASSVPPDKPPIQP